MKSDGESITMLGQVPGLWTWVPEGRKDEERRRCSTEPTQGSQLGQALVVGFFLRPYRCCWAKWHRPEHRRLTQAPLRRSSVLEERRSKKQRRVSSEARGVPTAALLGLTTKRTGEHDAPPARRMCVCWNARIRKGRRAAEDSALADVSGGFSGSVCGVGGGAVWA